MKNIIISASLVIIAFLTISLSDTNAWPKYRVYAAPKVHVINPGPRFVWVEGHYKVNKFGKMVWVPGHWKKV